MESVKTLLLGMSLIFGLLYTILFMSFLMTALFIVFHLMRYSLNRKVSVFGTFFFVSVFTILLFSNAIMFFSLPLASLLPTYSL
jgi:FtsH-binding integral membrane protein